MVFSDVSFLWLYGTCQKSVTWKRLWESSHEFRYWSKVDTSSINPGSTCWESEDFSTGWSAVSHSKTDNQEAQRSEHWDPGPVVGLSISVRVCSRFSELRWRNRCSLTELDPNTKKRCIGHHQSGLVQVFHTELLVMKTSIDFTQTFDQFADQRCWKVYCSSVYCRNQ